MASRNNCENFSGDQEQWRNCNPGRNMGYYPYAPNYNLNYGTPYGGMYPMGNSMAACDTTNTVYGRTTPQVTMNNSYPATTCLADSSDSMPYDMTNSYAPNASQQQLMPDGQNRNGGSTEAEAGSTPPNRTVHDIEPEKKYEEGDTETGESSGEEDWNKRQSKEKYMKILKEASEARDEYSNKVKKLIGEVNRHRSQQFNKLDQALEVLVPPNLKEKAISSSLKQDRRLPLRRRLRPVVTGVNPRQQLQEITKSLGEDAVMLLVSIGDMFINDLSSTEITAKYNIFTLNLVRNIRQVILNSFKRGARHKREQPPTRKRRRTAPEEPAPEKPTTQIEEERQVTPTIPQNNGDDQ